MTTLQYSENYLVTTTYPGFSGVTNQTSQVANFQQLGLFFAPKLSANCLQIQKLRQYSFNLCAGCMVLG